MQQKYKSKTLLQDTLVRHLFLLNMENQYFVNELRASFLLRKRKSRKPTSIYMSIYIGKKQFKFPLKVRVYPDHWSHKLQKAFTSNILCELDNKNNQIVNCKIDEYRERFNAFKNYLCNNSNEINRREAILKRYLKNDMKIWKNEDNPFIWMIRNIEKRVAPTSAPKMTKVIKDFEEYCKTKEIYTLESINLDFLEEYRETLKLLPGKRKGTLISINGVNYKMTILVGELRKAARHNLFNYNMSNIALYKPLPEKVKQYENQIALTLEEIKRIMELELSGTYKEIRDAFIFQSFVGQRFGDVKKFNNTFIRIKKDDKEFLQFIQQKRTHPVYIEVLPPVAKIIDKNTMNYHSPATANDYLKKIAKLAEIKGEYPYTTHTKNGIETKSFPRYKLIGTHTARRFFITWARANKVPDNIIMKITGLKDKDMLERYDKLSNENAAIEAGTILTKSLKKEGLIENNSSYKNNKNELENQSTIDTNLLNKLEQLVEEKTLLKLDNNILSEEKIKVEKELIEKNDLLKLEQTKKDYEEHEEDCLNEIPNETDFYNETTEGNFIHDKEILQIIIKSKENSNNKN